MFKWRQCIHTSFIEYESIASDCYQPRKKKSPNINCLQFVHVLANQISTTDFTIDANVHLLSKNLV